MSSVVPSEEAIGQSVKVCVSEPVETFMSTTYKPRVALINWDQV